MPDKFGMRLGGIILAGGRSRRMGRAKESLPIGTTTMLGRQCQTLLACTDAVVVVGRDPGQPLPPLPEGVHLAHDLTPGEGPLEAIAAGLCHLRDHLGFDDRDAAFATGCDQPYLTPRTVRWLAAHLDEGCELVMPRADDKLQPLTAVYRVGVRTTGARLLEQGVRRPRQLAAELPTRVLEQDLLREHDPELRFLRNLNHQEDYERACRELG